MLRLTDSRNYVNLQVLFNPREDVLEFSIMNYENQLNTIIFQNVPVSGS